jgi:hypothetical protein
MNFSLIHGISCGRLLVVIEQENTVLLILFGENLESTTTTSNQRFGLFFNEISLQKQSKMSKILMLS